MSDRYGSYPPDEPVIGADYPPSPSPSGYQQQPEYIGADGAWAQSGRTVTRVPDPEPVDYVDDDEYPPDDEEYEDDEDAGYYGEEYYEDSPARQPMFYVFIGLAALIGGGLIFLLFSLFGGAKDDDDPQTLAGFKVVIDSPLNNERIEIGKPKDFAVRATSNEQITKFELLVSEKPVDQLNVTAPGADNVYSALLQHTFERTGEYKVFVRVTSLSGATKDSESIKVVAIQSVGEKPVKVKGKVVGAASVRSGPSDTAPVIRTLNPGEEVDISGKTRDGAWLLLEADNGWVRKEAIDLLDSLALVPVKDPTPTPAPPTPTQVASPSATVSPTANPNTPDFVPVNAVVLDGGATLRITVQNLATAPFTGPLVVGVSKVGVSSPQVVVDASIPANGTVSVDFELDPPVTAAGSSAQVTVDPGNAIRESNEDNNGASFFLTPSIEAPDLKILAPTYQGTTMTVVIRNDGGELKASTIVVRVESGGAANEQSATVALAKGQSSEFTFTKPTTGPAKVRVLVNGQQVSAVDIDVP